MRFQIIEKTIFVTADGSWIDLGEFTPQIPDGYEVAMASVVSSWAWINPFLTNPPIYQAFGITNNVNQAQNVIFTAYFVFKKNNP